MSSAADLGQPIDEYDGVNVADLTRQLNVPRVVALDTTGSTVDVAHALAAEGAAAGTVVVANAQTAGRGRLGRTWRSASGAGVWLTVLERPSSSRGLDVLSLRVGIALAPALDGLVRERVRLKWPNDLYVGNRKLAGVLVEARWRDGAPEWVAIGVGINVRVPDEEPRAIGMPHGVTRAAVLEAAVCAIRAAASASGPLTTEEMHAFAARDFAVGRACVEPVVGRVTGIDPSGALLVDVGSEITVVRGGSLVLEEER